MAKNKRTVLDSKDRATEADLCPAVEGEPGSRDDAIRRAAYALYETRNGSGGSAEDDWLQAEAQIARIPSSGI